MINAYAVVFSYFVERHQKEVPYLLNNHNKCYMYIGRYILSNVKDMSHSTQVNGS